MKRWLVASLAFNMLLLGVLIGLWVNPQGPPPPWVSGPPPAPLGRGVADTLRGIVQQLPDTERRAESLAAIDRHLRTYLDRLGQMPGGPPSPVPGDAPPPRDVPPPAPPGDPGRLLDRFAAGTLTEADLDRHQQARNREMAAGRRLIDAILLDLTHILTPAERAFVRDRVVADMAAVRACIGGPGGSPPNP
ncbi:hypothetical protein [Roseospirillum parvum]|uniref:Heavy-metal resistance n=1 Tax=Roseospirillum parvum TaxID=83401 RepID=A0A1G8AMP4_9PROT|nr:hypothetical protein [Roseospirillum parvum]SDH22255.1 hypothetical protein SAMN05421742_10548 [Roseospirillum parvum]